VTHLWEATKLKVEQDNPSLKKGSDAYFEKVSELFDDVLDSQPNFTPLERSDTMRQKGEAAKTVTAFGSARSAQRNEVVQGYIVWKNTGDSTLLKRKMTGFAESQILMSIVPFLFNKLRKKDEKYLETLIKSVAGSLQGLDIIANFSQGYDFENMTIDYANEFISTIGKATRLIESSLDKEKELTKKQTTDAVWAIVDAVGLYFSASVKNTRLIGQDILSLPELVGIDTSALTIPYKQKTDPYTNAEYYREIATELKKDKPQLAPYIKNLPAIGGSIKGLESSLKTKVNDGTLDQSDFNKIVPKLK